MSVCMTDEPIPVANYQCPACHQFIGKKAEARERHSCPPLRTWGELRAVRRAMADGRVLT